MWWYSLLLFVVRNIVAFDTSILVVAGGRGAYSPGGFLYWRGMAGAEMLTVVMALIVGLIVCFCGFVLFSCAVFVCVQGVGGGAWSAGELCEKRHGQTSFPYNSVRVNPIRVAQLLKFCSGDHLPSKGNIDFGVQTC